MKTPEHLANYRPMAKKQLAEVVECYATVFTDWKVLSGDRLVRTNGPVLQQIGFDALRYRAYRPAAAVRALPLPNICMLHQFLDVKHEAVDLRAHPSEWKDVVTAMEQQFRPPIRKPLDLREVLALCERAAREKTNDLCMLAILHAYLGGKEKALSCCDRMQALPPAMAPRPDWELRHMEFCRELRRAIVTGKEREFLDTVRVEESP